MMISIPSKWWPPDNKLFVSESRGDEMDQLAAKAARKRRKSLTFDVEGSITVHCVFGPIYRAKRAQTRTEA